MDNTFCKMLQSATALCMALILAGCNGGTDDGSTTSGTKQPMEIASISAQNATFVTHYTGTYQVDLSDRVSVSNDQGFTLQSVRPLSPAPGCQPLSQAAQSFTIAADRSKSCDYQYQVSVAGIDATQAPSATAITRVAVTRDVTEVTEVELSSITISTMIEQSVDVNVREQLMLQSNYTIADDFMLSDVVILPYSEHTASVDVDNNTISYTPPAGYEGVERILFSYSRATSGEILIGTLDIVVSRNANQGMLIKKGQVNDKVEINQRVIISIEPFVTSLDDDDYELMYVDSFNAATSSTSAKENNKEFYFETSQFGAHYVSFAVTDHNGAYAMGIVKIPAYDPKNTAQWKGIAYQSLFFSGPLTTQYAAGEQIEYKTTLTDDTYSPAVDLALFDFAQAQRYCGTIGRLPTSDELVTLSGRDVNDEDNWPVSAQYLASDLKGVNLTSGTVDDYWGGGYLVSCIEGGMTVNPAREVIANGNDRAMVEFTLKGEGDQPMSDIAITFTTNSSNVNLLTPSVTTDETGKAIALLTSTKAEEVTVCGATGIQSTCTTVTFTGDPATAQVTNISLDVINWTPDSGKTYPLYATVKDNNGNVVKNAYVTFEIIQDTNTEGSASLLNSSSLTDSTGVASVTVSNTETYPNDKTEIVAAHTNTSGESSQASVISNWGSWQWKTPLIVEISDLTSLPATTADVCEPTFGSGYRIMNASEMSQYTSAANNGELIPESFDTDLDSFSKDPILSKVVEKSQQSEISASVSGAFPEILLMATKNNVWEGASTQPGYDSYTLTYTASIPYHINELSSTHSIYYYMGTIKEIHRRRKFFKPSFYGMTNLKYKLPRYNVICVKPAG